MPGMSGKVKSKLDKAMALAKSRETGKLTDKDVAAAKKMMGGYMGGGYMGKMAMGGYMDKKGKK